MTEKTGNTSGGGFLRAAPWLLAGAGLALSLFLGLDRGRSASCQHAVAPSCSSAVGQGSSSERPRVLVNGIATLEVIPDVADITVRLEIERASPRDAVQAVRAEQDALVAALNEDGIAGEHLRISHIGVSPEYDTIARVSQIRGYSASVSFVASVDDFTRLGDVLERVSGFQVKHLSTRFRSTELPAKKRALRTKALEAARAKAEQSAAVMGVQLGGVLSIEETSRNDRPGWGAVGNVISNEYVNAGPLEGSSVPGAVPISLSVEVGYALQP